MRRCTKIFETGALKETCLPAINVSFVKSLHLRYRRPTAGKVPAQKAQNALSAPPYISETARQSLWRGRGCLVRRTKRMINPTAGAGAPPPPPPQKTTLTEEQSTGLSDLLKEYDASDLSDDDAKAIVAQIKELGIAPGSGLSDALAAAGIDARDLADQAGIGGGPNGKSGPPPGGGEGRGTVNSDAVALIAEVLESMETDESETSFIETLKQRMEDQGISSSDPIIDYYA